MFALRGDQVPPQYPIVNVHVPERTLHDSFASVAPMGSFIRSGIERARQTDGWTGVCAAVCNARRCDQALILVDSSEKGGNLFCLQIEAKLDGNFERITSTVQSLRSKAEEMT